MSASDAIIEVTGLGKSYRLTHLREREHYTSLRDVIARKTRSLWRGTGRALRRQPAEAPRESEEFWALRNVSFAVKRGETVGIIGRNGAGKSTLLKILSRITEPTAGRVTLRGHTASLLEVGTGFHPELSGRENIYLNGAILGMPRAEVKRKFDAIVAFAEVEQFLDTPVKRYSSGMYVRLAFSVAAHLEPDILIVDEVLAVGDNQFQQKCLGKMENVSSAGRTILFVTHNLGAVTRLCTTSLLLERGVVSAIGPTSAVVSKYLNAAESAITAGHVLDIRARNVECRVSNLAVELTDADVIVRLTVSGTHRLPFLGIGITIRSDAGETVMTLRPAKTGFGVRNSDLPGRAVLTLPGLARLLSGGRYWISLWLTDPGIETFGQLVDALSFSVPERDVYGLGRSMNLREDGVLAVACRYSIEPSEAIVADVVAERT